MVYLPFIVVRGAEESLLISLFACVVLFERTLSSAAFVVHSFLLIEKLVVDFCFVRNFIDINQVTRKNISSVKSANLV